MLVKNKVIETVNTFSDNFSIDELIEKLIVLDRIDVGNNQSINNKIISEEELDKNIEEWFK
ncbi:MAG: hypothetical protein WCI53_08010 [Bacteroidota bacterium]|jgi:hypothetical protein